MKFCCLFFLFFVLAGCGVQTSSSQGEETQNKTASSSDTNISTDMNISKDTNISDKNSSTPTITDPIFEKELAEYDKNACSSAYATATPLQDNNTNDDRETNDERNGISLQSLLNGEKEDTTVIAFYKKLPVGTTVGPIEYRENLYGPNGAFLLTYDKVWAKVSENTIYVQLPKAANKLPSCYRATLNSETASSISFSKVYR